MQQRLHQKSVYLTILVLSLMASSWGVAVKNDAFLSLDTNTTSVSLTPHFQYFIDRDYSMSFEQVRAQSRENHWLTAPQLSELLKQTNNHIRANIWARLTIHHNSPIAKAYYLKLDNPLIVDLDVHFIRASELTTYKTGRSQPFSSRALAHRLYLFPLELAANETIDVYAKLNILGAFTVNPMVVAKDLFLQDDHTDSFRYALEIGCFLLLLCYSLAMWIYTLEKGYLYFSLLVLAAGLNQLTLSGYGFQYLFAQSANFNTYSIFIFTALSCIFANLFTIHFLKLSEYSRILLYACSSIIVGYLLLLLKIFTYDTTIIDISTVFFSYTFIALTPILSLIAGIYVLWVKKLTIARFYVAGWLCHITITTFYILGRLGFIPFSSEAEVSGFSTSLIICLLLISFSIGDKVSASRKILDQSRENLDRVINSIPSLLIIIDKNFKIANINQFALKRLGFEAEELINKNIRKLIESSTDYLVFSQAMTEHRDSVSFRFNYWDKHKKKIPVVFSHTKFYDVKILDERILCVAHDISELKQAEKEKDAMLKQMSSDQRLKVVGQLASSVSHELKNILTPIEGYSDLLLYDNTLADNHKSTVQQIQEAVDLGKSIIAQILITSQGGKTTVTLTPIDLVKTTQDALRFIKAMLPKNIKVVEQYHIGQAILLSHSGHIHQILLNLCANANHAVSPVQGLITVVVDKKQIRDKPDMPEGQYFCVSVIDNGHGMDAATMRCIFEPFFTTKSEDKGTGLGLYIIEQMVKSMNAYIKVISELNKGARFDIYFRCDSKPN